MKHFHIIDTLGPFVTPSHHKTINWSKVDFSSLETDGRIQKSMQQQIITQFTRYIAQVADLGYDTISVDDLAHLVVLPFYNAKLQMLLHDYRDLYKNIFTIAKKQNLKIFINTDYLFFNQDIQNHLASSKQDPLDFYCEVLTEAFESFSEIDGIILRIGENDGKDVEGVFHSQLLLKTPAQANELLTKTLPIFEEHHKTLIFRTWTVGVYEIGDLIWNESTYDKVFGSIKSDALVISMKFGDTDFMRYLSLNPLFGRGNHKQIVELQTRREWEGMGTFPSFVGWDYERYLRQLSSNKNLVGIHVWCQTGGWAKPAWSTLTYLDTKSFWNELNTEVTIDLAKHALTVEAAVRRFCQRRNITQVDEFIKLLHHSETAVLKGLYFPDIAKKTLYFRRVRIPPLTWLTWDKIHLPVPVIYFHRLLTPVFASTIKDADEAIAATAHMIQIAKHINLAPAVIDSLLFEHATLVLFAKLKRYIFGQLSKQDVQTFNKDVRAYTHRYPQHYAMPQLSFRRFGTLPRALLRAVIRTSAPYRARDRALLKTSGLQARLIRLYLRKSKSHLKDQSMGFEVFFK